MKNTLFYVLLVAAALLYPKEKSDVGRLHPVEVVYIYKGNQITIMTDTGDRGKGQSVDEALEDLKRTTPGTVYLDTADYLIISEGCIKELRKCKAIFKDSVRVCYAEPNLDLVKAAEYLSVHRPSVRLGEIEAGGIQHLTAKNGILKLE